MPKQQSDLLVITKTKNLASYVFTITHKSPKEYRYSLVSRMQHRFRKLKQEYANGLIELDDIKPVMQSYTAHLAHGNAWQLLKTQRKRFVLTRSQG